MKILKIILVVVAVLIAIPLVGGLFINGAFKAEREVVINKPKQEVWNYIVLLKNQNSYSKWAAMDPNMTKTFTGTDGTVGFVSAWKSESKDVGAGEQEIKKITDGERIDYELRFLEPFKSTNTAYMATESVSPTQTKVKWGFAGKMNYPMNFMMLFMDMEKEVGKDFQTGLDNLKAILEK